MVDTTAAVGAAEAPSGEAPASGGGASKAVLADRFEIDLRARLAELDSPTAQAYAAKENKTGARPVFALVCRPDIPVRSTVVRHLGDRPSPGTLTIFAGGTIDIGDGERRYAVILERPAGGRLWPRADKPAAPIPEKVILDKILPQLSAAVDALAQRGIIHRAIRPDNLYWLDPEGSHVVLGDCVTCLPGRGNPPVYETTERAMASPLDRGDGHAAEDYYALGVTVLALANGKDPAQGRDETALIATKVANGTYAALSVGLDVSAALAEPIRGLIADDAPHRWTHAEIKQMMSGRASRAPRAHIEKRATQAIRFKDTQIHHPRLLAMAVGRNPREGLRMLREHKVAEWAQKFLMDADLAKKLEAFFGSSDRPATSMLADDVLAAQACILLDPGGPIRYKGLALMPDGLGGVLADAFITGNRDTIQILAELFSSDVPRRWVEHMREKGRKVDGADNVFGHMRGYMADPNPGAGIERCLYALVPGTPCRSAHVLKDRPITLAELMFSLEAIAGKAGDAAELVDRHVAAFACSRSPKAEGQLQAVLKSGDGDGVRRLAGLALLAYVQEAYAFPPMPRLAKWAAGRFAPMLALLHNRNLRRELTDRAKAVAAEGRLKPLLDLVGDKIRDTDGKAYKAAVKEYLAIAEQTKALEADAPKREARAKDLGRAGAFLISYALLVMSLVFSAFVVVIR